MDDQEERVNWQDIWEQNARQEQEDLSHLTEQELLTRLDNGQIDQYFQIWDAFAEKGTPQSSAIPLWNFLRDNPGEAPMLHRYHCTAALFKILGTPDAESENPLRKSVQWDHKGEPARQKALEKLKRKIESLLEKIHSESRSID